VNIDNYLTNLGKIRGASDMLRESAKHFRQVGQPGHAYMCEQHADTLDDMLDRKDRPAVRTTAN
jgi:hypothetical protein